MNILIALNGSAHTDAILRFCAQIAIRAGETLTILLVSDHRTDQRSSKADALVNHAKELLNIQDFRTLIRFGQQAKEILREAKQGDYDLLIVGEDQIPYLARHLQDSIAVRVAAQAPCPTIIVKGSSRQIRRILLCDSGAGRSSLLSQFTAQLIDMITGEEEVTILHVMSQISAGPGVQGQQLRANEKELIEAHTVEGELLGGNIRALEQHGIYSIPKVRRSLVVDEILTEARSGDYDLIVLGAHKRKIWLHILLEDVTRKVLIQSDRPVLVVR